MTISATAAARVDNEPVERICPEGRHGHDDDLCQQLNERVAAAAVLDERAEECTEPGVENNRTRDHYRIQNSREQRIRVRLESYLSVHDERYRVADDGRDEIRIHISLILDPEKRENRAVRHRDIVEGLEHDILEQSEHAELYQRRGCACKSELYEIPYLCMLFEKASALLDGIGFFHDFTDRARAFSLFYMPGFSLPLSV